jgi:hypothetical protein
MARDGYFALQAVHPHHFDNVELNPLTVRKQQTN